MCLIQNQAGITYYYLNTRIKIQTVKFSMPDPNSFPMHIPENKLSSQTSPTPCKSLRGHCRSHDRDLLCPLPISHHCFHFIPPPSTKTWHTNLPSSPFPQILTSTMLTTFFSSVLQGERRNIFLSDTATYSLMFFGSETTNAV